MRRKDYLVKIKVNDYCLKVDEARLNGRLRVL